MNYADFRVDYRVTTLASGLMVAHRYLQIPDVVFIMGVNEGSIHEPDDQRGILHFIEHLFCRSKSGEDIKRKLEDITGRTIPHGETSPEHVLFKARMPVQDFGRFLEVWSQTTLNRHYLPSDFERERRVVLNEITPSSEEGTLQHYMMTLRRDKLFPESVLGREVGGTPEHVQRITPDDVVSYKRERLNASNTYITVVGGCSFEETKSLLERHFADFQPGSSRPLFLDYIPEALPFEDRRSFEGLSYPCLLMTFQSPGYHSFDILPMNMICDYLGGGASSRLMYVLREKYGLCYDAKINHTDFSSFNKNQTSIGITHFNVRDVSLIRKLIEEELDKIKHDQFDHDLLQQSRTGFVKRFYQNYLQSPTDQAEVIDNIVRCKGPYDLEGLVRGWRETSTEELVRVARYVFNGRYVITLLTPKSP